MAVFCHALGICDDAVAPLFLGLVERLVGMVGKLFRLLAMLRVVGDADRQRGVDELVAKRDACLGEQLAQLVGTLDRSADGHLGQHQHELLAAIAAGDVALAAVLLHQLGKGLEGFVATEVTIGVVDLLEEVQIHQDHAQRIAFASGAGELADQGFVQIAAVVEAGERVADRLFAQLFLQRRDFLVFFAQFGMRLGERDFHLLALGDVLGHHGELAALGAVGIGVEPAQGLLRVTLEAFGLALQGDFGTLFQQLGIDISQHFAGAFAGECGGRLATDILIGRIDLDETVIDGAAIAVANQLVQGKAVVHGGEQAAETLLIAAQLIFQRLLALALQAQGKLGARQPPRDDDEQQHQEAGTGGGQPDAVVLFGCRCGCRGCRIKYETGQIGGRGQQAQRNIGLGDLLPALQAHAAQWLFVRADEAGQHPGLMTQIVQFQTWRILATDQGAHFVGMFQRILPAAQAGQTEGAHHVTVFLHHGLGGV